MQENDLICKQIGVCNSTIVLTKQHTTVVAKTAMPKQSLCDMCKLLVTFIKPYVDSNSTEVSHGGGIMYKFVVESG